MPKMTPAERAELEAKLAADDDDDDSDEVTISHGDTSFTGTFRRARAVARSWGVKLEPDPEPAADPKGGKDETPTRFGRRVS